MGKVHRKGRFRRKEEGSKPRNVGEEGYGGFLVRGKVPSRTTGHGREQKHLFPQLLETVGKGDAARRGDRRPEGKSTSAAHLMLNVTDQLCTGCITGQLSS